MDLQQLNDVSIVAGAVFALAGFGWLEQLFRRKRSERRFVRRARRAR